MSKLETSAKVAPKITFDDVFGDDRMKMELEWDAKEPEFKHFWMSSLEVSKSGPGKHREVVSGVEHGNDVLVRTPREPYAQKRQIMNQRSFETAAKMRGIAKDEAYSTGNLKQFAKDVKV